MWTISGSVKGPGSRPLGENREKKKKEKTCATKSKKRLPHDLESLGTHNLLTKTKTVKLMPEVCNYSVA